MAVVLFLGDDACVSALRLPSPADRRAKTISVRCIAVRTDLLMTQWKASGEAYSDSGQGEAGCDAADMSRF